MIDFISNPTNSLVIEGFNILILIMVTICLIYQTRENKERLWQIFLCYSISLLLSQLFDLAYKVFNHNSGIVIFERISSTFFGYLSFIATAFFVMEFVKQKKKTRNSFITLIISLLVLAMLCSLFNKAKQVLGFDVSDLFVNRINIIYEIAFDSAMVLEVIFIIHNRKVLKLFDSIVFVIIPLMHIVISNIPIFTFNFQYIIRNVVSTILTILVLGISMVYQTRALTAQKEESKNISNALDKYVGEKIAKEILSSENESAREKDVTVMFADIQGYSKRCESLSPKEALRVLNKCLSVIDKYVTHYGGVLDKYIGDCGMAFWNGITEHSNAEHLASACALDIRKEIEKLFSKDARDITINIGINSGKAIVGNVGSKERTSFSVIGDNVNVAERIQSKAHGGKIYISESVKEKLNDVFVVEFVENVLLEGKTNMTSIYELEPRR